MYVYDIKEIAYLYILYLLFVLRVKPIHFCNIGYIFKNTLYCIILLIENIRIVVMLSAKLVKDELAIQHSGETKLFEF